MTSVAGAERGIIKNSKVFVDCSARGLRWKPLIAFDPFLPIGICLDQARVDCEAFAANQPLPNAAAQDGLEHATEKIALSEAAVPVLRERRVIGGNYRDAIGEELSVSKQAEADSHDYARTAISFAIE